MWVDVDVDVGVREGVSVKVGVRVGVKVGVGVGTNGRSATVCPTPGAALFEAVAVLAPVAPMAACVA